MFSRLKNYLRYKPFVRDEFNRLYNLLEFSRKADELTRLAIHSNEKGISNTKYCDKELIVSLTTYGRRLHEAHLPIESIMQGSVKPNRIVLNIDEKYMKSIPTVLKNQQRRGLEINACKDIRSYTKLIPTLKAYPEAAIVTIDDDLIYKYDIVEKLLRDFIEEPDVIHANRIHKIILNEDGTPKGYMDWELSSQSDEISPLNFLTGVGGVIYPPHCFPDEVFNESVFLDICKYADDIWFYSMALMNNVGIRRTFTHSNLGEDYILNESVQNEGLKQKNFNTQLCRNDIQLKAVFDKYDLWRKLS